MTYKLFFDKRAHKEWQKLDVVVKNQFKKKLAERLKQPELESCRVSGAEGCYKIKLRAAGYRLIYQVVGNELIILVLAVGKRERNAVYKAAIKRI